MNQLLVEVELKYMITPSEVNTIKSKLVKLGCQIKNKVIEKDLYYQHPLRDFWKTDEVLRLRRTENKVELTYKGPRRKSIAKIRKEISVLVSSLDDMHSILTVLGFKPVAEVVKERRGIRLKEYQVVALYKRMYDPKIMYLISRTKVPSEVVKYLSNEGIKVIDNVKFDEEPLRSVANELIKYAKGASNTSLIIDEELMNLIKEATKVVNVPLRSNLGDVIKDILRKLITNYER